MRYKQHLYVQSAPPGLPVLFYNIHSKYKNKNPSIKPFKDCLQLVIFMTAAFSGAQKKMDTLSGSFFSPPKGVLLLCSSILVRLLPSSHPRNAPHVTLMNSVFKLVSTKSPLPMCIIFMWDLLSSIQSDGYAAPSNFTHVIKRTNSGLIKLQEGKGI